MILLLNGAFGIGKSTVARRVADALPRSVVFDPELIGLALQRCARLVGARIADFQDLVLWRRLTVLGIRAARVIWPNVIVPMAFSNVAYLREIRARLGRIDPRVFHLCLVAPVDVVHARLRSRGADPVTQAWEYERAAECCAVHGSAEFAEQVVTTNRDCSSIAEEVLHAIGHSGT